MQLLSAILAFAAFSAAAPAPGPAAKTDQTYQDTALAQHNVHRANHSSPALIWSDKLANDAQIAVNPCVYKDTMNINGDNYGINIQAGSPPSEIGQVISGGWYNDEEPLFSEYYGNPSPPDNNFDDWGHFTQVVWKNTKYLGCATKSCPGGVKDENGNVMQGINPWFTVCTYQPGGNIWPAFARNVGKPLGKKTVSG